MPEYSKRLVANIEYVDGVEVGRAVHLHEDENCRVCKLLDATFKDKYNAPEPIMLEDQPYCEICAQAKAEGVFDA